MAASKYRVTIDIDRLCEKFCENDGMPWSNNHIEQWLRDQGFTEQEDGWVCDQEQLEMLDSDVIQSKQLML